MAGNIKGITIEFNGDTTKLDKALREINKNTRSLDKELKQVDNALKFNPTNVDLWKQKQTLLTQKIEETKKKLDVLKQAQAKMDAEGVDKNSKEYRELQRQIIVTENQVKNFESQLRKVGNVNLRAASEQFKDMGTKLTSAGQAMSGLSKAAAAVTAAIGALTVKSGRWADDLNTMSKQTGLGTKELQKYSAAADLVDVSVEAIAKTHTILKKNMFSARDGGAAAEAFEELGIAVTDSNGNLRDADTVWQEAIKALGTMENETERDALAMKLMGKSASELNPLIEDGGETYENFAKTLEKYDLEFIDQDTLDNANKFNDSLDTVKAVGLLAFQQLGTKLAGYLAPAMEKVVDVVGRLAKWFSELSPETQALIAGVGAVVAAIAPLLIGLGKVSFAISSIMSLMATLGPAIGGIVATMGPWVLAIGAAVAAGILLYKNWDKIKKFAKKLAKELKKTWNDIKKAITDAITNAKDKVLKTWDAIKNGVTTAVNAVKTTVTNVFNTIKSTISTIWNNIKTNITTTINNIKTAISNAFNAIKTNITNSVNAWKTTISNAWAAIKTAVKTAVDAVKNTITTAFNAIKTTITTKLNEWKNAITNAWTAIKTTIKAAVDAIKTTITTVFESIKKDVSTKVEAIKTKVTETFKTLKTTVETKWKEIKTAISNAIDGAKDKVKKTVDAIKTKVSETFETIKSTVKTKWDAIKTNITTPITNAKDKVSDIVGKIKTKVTDTFDTLKSSVKNKWDSIKEAITNPITKAKETISGIVDKIKGFFPINLGKIFSGIKLPHFKINGGEAPWGIGGKGTAPSIRIDWYKDGGIFNKATLAGIGEAGPEAVVPLDKLWNKLDNLQGGNTYNFYITGDNPKAIADEVKRILIKETNQRRLAWQ